MNSFTNFFVLLFFILVIGCSFKIGSVDKSSEKTGSELKESCKTTYFEYQSLQKIANNSYLQLVFDNNIEFTQGNQLQTDDGVVYQIGYPTQTYLSATYQNLNSYFGQNNDIIFEGGKFQFQTVFTWSEQKKNSPKKSGMGVALGITKEIPYSIRKSQTAYGFVLNQVGKFIVSQFGITNITCINQDSSNCSLTADEMNNITFLLTKDTAIATSIKTSLERKVSNWLNSTLSETVCCTNPETFTKFEYNWKNTFGTSKLIIHKNDSFSLIVKNGSAQGYYESADFLIENFLDGKCGPLPTNSSLDPSKYGGSQQFISKTFMENFLVSASRNMALNMYLNDSNCKIQGFNFTAAALVPILSNIKQTFDLSATVVGNCQPIEDSIKINQTVLNEGFRVLLTQQCELLIQGRKVVGFQMLISSVIVPKPNYSNQIDFQKKDWAFSPRFDTNYGFSLLNKLQAENYMIDAFSKVMTGNLLGSGWPIFLKMKNPKIFMTETAMVVYDQDQINPQQ